MAKAYDLLVIGSGIAAQTAPREPKAEPEPQSADGRTPGTP